ncbi:MAG: inorganic phosphate transporter [Alphaproteobacteria bacterium]|nr:inorganic phosphate transporter [Alphaproteobacteria bacterium]
MHFFSLFVIGVVVVGLFFDFVNGFHDAANSIATIVATRVMKPWQAVLWAAFFNFAALFLFGTGVAKTMGAGLIALPYVTPQVVLCGLLGGIVWGLLTWRLGLPTSSSHALMGGYAGAAMANSVVQNGWSMINAPIIAAGWIKVVAFIVIAPVLGMVLAHGLMGALGFAARRGLAADGLFYRRAQLVSSAFLSLMHGSNDAQKTAGIITGAMVAAGALHDFVVPGWVLAASYAVMGLGTLAGGWRIVRTMGHRLTLLHPQGGVCAEGASALSILAATFLGLPVSTTHVTTGAILGVGVARDASRVRWGVARRIAWGWILTIPAAGFVGAAAMVMMSSL